MSLSPSLVRTLYKNGDMRPTGEWITCAGVGCVASADHDVVHEPPDGQRFYVPLCEGCIEAMFERQVEYLMEAHGFFGVPSGGAEHGCEPTGPMGEHDDEKAGQLPHWSEFDVDLRIEVARTLRETLGIRKESRTDLDVEEALYAAWRVLRTPAADPVSDAAADDLREWSEHIWHVSQHSVLPIALGGRLQTIANQMRTSVGLPPLGWNDAFPDARFGECSVHVVGCEGQETHGEASA